MVKLKEIVTLLVVGYCISYVLEPVLKWLEKNRISRPIGFFAVIGVLAIFFTILLSTAIPTLVGEYRILSSNLVDYVDTAKERGLDLIFQLQDKLPGTVVVEVKKALESPNLTGDWVPKILSALGRTLLGGYSLTLTIVNILLLPFIVYYLVLDFPSLHRAMLEFFPVLARRRVEIIGREIDQYVSAFVRGQFTVCAILFLLYAVGLKIIGIELWFLAAFISGFGNIVPYVGTISGLVLSSVMALVTFGDLNHLLQVFGLFGLVQLLEGTFITPKILGDKVGLSPLTIILAIVIGGSMLGLLGVFLAVPGAAVIKVLLRHTRYWVLAHG